VVVHLIYLRRMLVGLMVAVGGMAMLAGAKDRTEERLSDALVKAVRKAMEQEAALSAYCESKGMAKGLSPLGLGPACVAKPEEKKGPTNAPAVPSSAPPEAK
jgi:hypothetical protein